MDNPHENICKVEGWCMFPTYMQDTHDDSSEGADAEQQACFLQDYGTVSQAFWDKHTQGLFLVQSAL